MPPSAASSTVLFDAIRGHSRQITRLREAVAAKRLPHALLFAGPRGVGKRRIALAFSQALLCSSEPRPCGVCVPCVKIARNAHPDLLFLSVNPENKSGKILIDQMHDLCKQIALKPGESSVRPVIIDDADRMNPDAQNAFLKALEEPPGPTHFFLISSDPDGLLPTIRSRCQTVSFGGLSPSEAEDILLAEDNFSPREASDYARLSQGSIEEALILKDGGYREVVDQAFSLVRLSGQTGAVEWPPIETKRDELLLLTDALMRIYRDALILLTTADTKRLFLVDRTADLQDLARHLNTDRCEQILESLAATRDRLLSSVNPRLAAARLLLDLGIKLF